MRRGYALILLVSVIGSWTPSAFGQNPYPYPPQPGYGPMPGQYMPPSPYGPMPPPGYYPPPMPQQQPPRVFVYGPLTAIPPDPTAPLGQAPPQPMPAKTAPKAGKANDLKANVSQTQLSLPPVGAKETTTTVSRDLPPEAYTAACFDNICAPTPIYDFIPKDPVLPGHGHFFAEVGAVAVVPYMNPHTAYTTTTPLGAVVATDFPRQADFGPSVNFGYMAHNGWGIRADYWYLHGDINETLANGNPNTIISTPTIGVSPSSAASFALLNGTTTTGRAQISGPSYALLNGVQGPDQYHFAQRLDVQVADVEIIKACQFLDTTFLFGAGVRYAHFEQTYEATRSNPGLINNPFTYFNGIDRTDFSSLSRYEGWGPTLSFEMVHPIFHTNFALYANLRASFLWGTEAFQQSGMSQLRAVPFNVPGVSGYADNYQAAAAQLNVRQVEVGEAEVGVQYGCYLGRRVYVYGRVGISVQRWFNVGNPTENNGNVEFFGGTAKIGLTF